MSSVGPVVERFLEKYSLDSESGCWVWTSHVDGCGYGRFKLRRRMALAHRVAYELFVGPLPAILDHICGNRRCVNPLHLRPSTHRDNTLRGAGPTAINSRAQFCKHGHPFTEQNTYWRPRGGRDCRICIRARLATYRATKSAA